MVSSADAGPLISAWGLRLVNRVPQHDRLTMYYVSIYRVTFGSPLQLGVSRWQRVLHPRGSCLARSRGLMMFMMMRVHNTNPASQAQGPRPPPPASRESMPCGPRWRRLKADRAASSTAASAT